MPPGPQTWMRTQMPAIKNHILSPGGVINIGFSVNDFAGRMKRGERPGEALLKTAGHFVAGEFISGYWWGLMVFDLAKSAGEIAIQGHKAGMTAGIDRAGHFSNVNPIEIGNSATIRQRSLAALSQSRMNAQSVLGSEARMLHRNQVSY
jgi:hypothetical protein